MVYYMVYYNVFTRLHVKSLDQVRSVLQLVDYHLQDHAGQISKS